MKYYYRCHDWDIAMDITLVVFQIWVSASKKRLSKDNIFNLSVGISEIVSCAIWLELFQSMKDWTWFASYSYVPILGNLRDSVGVC